MTASISIDCTPFSLGVTDDEVADAGPGDGKTPMSAIVDASEEDRGEKEGGGEEGASLELKPGEKRCFNLKESTAGFDLQGSAAATAQGVVLKLFPNEHSRMRRTFRLNEVVRRSIVETKIYASLSSSTNPWSANAWIELMSQFYGEPATHQETAFNSLKLTRKQASSYFGLLLDVWSQAGVEPSGRYQLDFTSAVPFFSRQLSLHVDTEWSAQGQAAFTLESSMGSSKASVNAALSTIEDNSVTIEMGGATSHEPPNLTLIVSELCMTLED